MSYCTLFLSHAGSRIWNQTNAGGPCSFYVPHSTMALSDFTGLYVTPTNSSCCWEWYQGWLAVISCVGGWQSGEEGWRSKTEVTGRGRREGGRVVGLRNLLTFTLNLLEWNKTAHMQLFHQFWSFYLQWLKGWGWSIYVYTSNLQQIVHLPTCLLHPVCLIQPQPGSM